MEIIEHLGWTIAKFLPIFVAIILFIEGRDKRIEKLTTLKKKIKDFNEDKAVPSEYELKEIDECNKSVEMMTKEGKSRYKFFLIWVFICMLLSLTFGNSGLLE